MAKFGTAEHPAQKPVLSAIPASRAMFARMAKFDLPKARSEAVAAAFSLPPLGIPEALFEKGLRGILKPRDGI